MKEKVETEEVTKTVEKEKLSIKWMIMRFKVKGRILWSDYFMKIKKCI